MCDCNNNNSTGGSVEHYGNIHLNPNEYPIPQDERGIHKCGTGMYPCDHFPEGYHMPVTPECPTKGPISRSHATDPAQRYKFYDQQTHNVGTGCMNLDCMCPNCNGDCKCLKGMLGGMNLSTMTMNLRTMNLSTMNYVGIAIILYILYYLINSKTNLFK
jgi:hypothetical protein